jgi:UDP-2,4-diacetamido-2,4,6-trideoxy-beta-L-altropyranose hydrolase
MNKWVAIRCDANSKVGLGHFMRCFAIAEFLVDDGYKVVFLMRNPEYFCFEKIKNMDLEIVSLNAYESSSEFKGPYAHSSWLPCSELEDALECANKMRKISEKFKKNADFIIVDHYALGKPWEKKLADFGKIIALDDLNDRPHFCSLLIDQTYGKTINSYHGLTNQDARVLTGTKYSILRKEFLIERSKGKPNKNKIENILVTFGGVDSENYTEKLLDGLMHFDAKLTFSVTIVVSSLNPNIHRIKRFQHDYRNIEVITDAPNMAEIMSNSDFCFGAVGSTTWERFALSLPSALCVIANNQFNAAQLLVEAGLIRVLNMNSKNFYQEIVECMEYFLQSDNYKNNLKLIGSVVDGKGVQRIVREAKELKV